ncbi:MAG: tRNA pseudouridine(13) synthase TruD [Candidatus Thermoplasmatota archaeon]
MNRCFDVLEAEKNIGIYTFLTSNCRGVGGSLRVCPEDFYVEEISVFPPEVDDGRFTIAKVESVNWETNHLVKVLSNRLGVSRKRISFAGTKDKRAKTCQLMSFYKIPCDDLLDLNIKDVDIEDVYRSERRVDMGNLVGNRFKVLVRNLRKTFSMDDVRGVVEKIDDVGGFPNFFGVQRFGVVRPNTHVVGRYLVEGDVKEAVWCYIGNPMSDENEETYRVRKKLEETGDFSEALKSYPDYLGLEKAILNYLVKNPDGYVDALKELPKNLLTMFIYAYQSYLFNKMLSMRLERGLPLDRAVEGDIVLPVRKGVLQKDELIGVNSYNLDKVNEQISKGKGFVSGMLLGYDSEFSKGEMGEIEHSVVDQEGLDSRDFVIPEMPFLSTSGTRRCLMAEVDDLNYTFRSDSENDEKQLELSFELGKGCYATCLLREFMKADDIRFY